MRLRHLALATVAALAIPAALVAGPRFATLFKSTFDIAGQSLQAEVGDLVLHANAGFSILPLDPSGKNLGALFDDTQLAAPIKVALKGMFANDAAISSGELLISFQLAAGSLGSGFETGIVTDDPSNDFYPCSGSGTGGHVVVGGMPVEDSLPLFTKVQVVNRLSRPYLWKDWKSQVTLTPLDAAGNPITQLATKYDAVLKGSAGEKVLGVGFVKPAGAQGVFLVDDVTVVHKTP